MLQLKARITIPGYLYYFEWITDQYWKEKSNSKRQLEIESALGREFCWLQDGELASSNGHSLHSLFLQRYSEEPSRGYQLLELPSRRLAPYKKFLGSSFWNASNNNPFQSFDPLPPYPKWGTVFFWVQCPQDLSLGVD